MDMPVDMPAAAYESTGPQPAGPRDRGRLRIALAQLQVLANPFKTVERRFARYGMIYRVKHGSQALYVVRDPEHVRDVLVTHAAAFGKQHSAFQRLASVLGDALLTSEGERWRRQRRLVQPAFARQRLIDYSVVMADEAARLADSLPRADVFDLGREMNALTLRIVAQTLFGQRLVESGETARAMRDFNRWITLPPLFSRFVPGARTRLKNAMAMLDAKIAQLVEVKRAQLEREPEQCKDLLAALLSVRETDAEALSAQELRDQLLTLYLAGHETTAQALTFTFYLLAANPGVQEKLYAELQRVLAGRTPSYADLEQLPYTEQVVKEAMRLYPPAPVIPRHAAADTSIGPYPVPEGSEVVIWSYLTHRDPRFYPDPERFVPERFTPEAEASRPKHAYLPFGAGQRACIGQAFAMIEAQLIVATLCSKLRFTYAGRRPMRVRAGVTLSPRGGMPMRVYARSVTELT